MTNNWQTVKLKDVCENIFSGGTPDTRKLEYWNGEFHWLSSGETRNRFIATTEKTITQMGITNSSTRLVNIGDVLIASAGQGKTRGQTSFALINTYINQSIIALRANRTKLNPLYLFYLLNGKYDFLRNMSDANSIRGSLTCKMFENIDIYLPVDVQNQKNISGILYNYDQLIENNNKRIQILESMAKLIYDEWFVKFKFPGHERIKVIDSGTELGEIPEGWEIKKISDVATITKGLSYKSENLVDNGKIAFITLKSVERGGGFRYDGLKRFEGDFKEKHVVREGDIIMAVTDMTQNREIVARAARVPRLNETTMIISMDLVKVTPNRNIDMAWLYGLLNYSEFGIKMKEFANGVNVLHLKSEPIEEYQFIFPNKDTTESYSEIISSIYKQIDNLQLKNQNLANARDLLLPKLISGELDVSELDIKVSEVNV